MNKRCMKILHENAFGYVAKCKCCNDLQLGLGNIVLTFTEAEYKQFDLFFDEVREVFETEKNMKCSNQKYFIRTNYNGMVLSFTYQELRNTIELLNFSNVMLCVNELTKF